MLTFCTRTVIDHTAKGRLSKNLYREQHAGSIFVYNRYTGIYLYVVSDKVLNVCTGVSSSTYAYVHTTHGRKKLIGIDYTGVSVLSECVHLIP